MRIVHFVVDILVVVVVVFGIVVVHSVVVDVVVVGVVAAVVIVNAELQIHERNVFVAFTFIQYHASQGSVE